VPEPGVVPVFAVPHEMGIQASIESLNGRWQAKVWARFQHPSLEALQVQAVVGCFPHLRLANLLKYGL
jgi:hypothetical protein